MKLIFTLMALVCAVVAINGLFKNTPTGICEFLMGALLAWFFSAISSAEGHDKGD